MKEIVFVMTFALLTAISCGQKIKQASPDPINKTTQEVSENKFNKSLATQLDSIYNNDQKYRQKIDETAEKYGWESKQMKALGKTINTQDSINLIQVKAIIDKYGWLGKDIAGEEGNSALFLVIQHSDLTTWSTYLPKMRAAVKDGRASGGSLALLEDRTALALGKKQTYGSQIGMDPVTHLYYVLPLEDPDNVDERRAKAGLPPMAEYASRWQIKWDVEQYKNELKAKENATQPDLKKFYDEFKVEGSFILYDQKNNKYTYHNKQQSATSFTPASTFKICNSLIALETGIIADENVVFKWDGKERQIPAWNADTDMRNAFKNSTVWYYQELARRTGEQRMKFWLDKAKYGNADISGGIDGFWLWGGLRITPAEQIDFLRKLHDNKLPFSPRSVDIVKSIMIVKDSSDYVIRAKTGSGKQGDQYIGWYVGYITTKDNVYYFSNCIQANKNSPDFGKARLEIVYNILDALNVLKK